jgi:hypothetical protein
MDLTCTGWLIRFIPASEGDDESVVDFTGAVAYTSFLLLPYKLIKNSIYFFDSFAVNMSNSL